MVKSCIYAGFVEISFQMKTKQKIMNLIAVLCVLCKIKNIFKDSKIDKTAHIFMTRIEVYLNDRGK